MTQIDQVDSRHSLDQATLRELWLTHRRWVAAILIAHKPEGDDLEDLLHEVALRLVRSAGELRDPAAVRPWLRTVAVNVARTAGRKARVRRLAKDTIRQLHRDQVQASEWESDVATHVSASEEADAVIRAAKALPDGYREPLLLRAVRGMSYKQIADTLGIPITTVETRLARARRMLRDQLKPIASDAEIS